MKYRIRMFLSELGLWLWEKNRMVTATEIAMLHEFKEKCCCRECWKKEVNSHFKWECEKHREEKV